MSTVIINVELAPFPLPERAFELVPESNLPSAASPVASGVTKRIEQAHFPLSALDVDTLVAMCDTFTDEVFAAAGKIRPPK